MSSLITNKIRLLLSRGTRTLPGVLAPIHTARINLGIGHHLPALAAFELRLILEKLDRITTAGTSHLEYIFRLPKPLILSGTSDHLLFSDFRAIRS